MRRWFAILALLLLLTGCGQRIVTPLTPGEHVERVELSDGVLVFSEYEVGMGYPLICYSMDGFEASEATYDEVTALLGYDLQAALSDLPERLQLRPADLVTDVWRIADEEQVEDYGAMGHVWGGLTFGRTGGLAACINDKPWAYEELRLHIGYEGERLNHPCYELFRVVPWDMTDDFHNKYFPPPDTRSRVGEVEVGLLHQTLAVALAPDAPNEQYYAGFTVNGVSYVLFSEYGYCTQEEFIQLLLALIAAAR